MTDGTSTLGRFVLGERIAAGGMASVHVAEAPVGDRLHGCPLALKVLHDYLAEDDDFIRMFRDEGKIASRMAHPGVVRVHEVGMEDGRHYIAMERVDGYNLAQVLAAHKEAKKNFPAAAVFAVLRQVLGALAYIHGFSDKRGRNIGIVHRDISPQNILIGRDEKLRIADFGIARGHHRADRTRTGTVKGKLHYMPPEQARGQRVDARADLYSMGAVAFELWTRQPLHGAEQTSVLHGQAASGAIDFSRPEFKKLNASVRNWLQRALDPKPEMRFQTAIDMLGAMENLTGASRARFKPGTLTRLLKEADTHAANATKGGPQYLFSADEMAWTTRKGGKKKREPTPQRPMSGVFLGVSAVSRRELQPSRRLTATHGAPDDWSDTPPPVPSPAARRKNRSSSAKRTLPVERFAAKSGAYRRPLRASQRLVLQDDEDAQDINASDGVEGELANDFAEGDNAPKGKQKASRQRKDRSRPSKSAVNTSSRNSRTKTKPARQRAPKRSSRLEKRNVLEQQRSLAAASVVMWSSVALLLFAMLLEAWNARIDFPQVDNETFTAWFLESPPPQTEADKPVVHAVTSPKRWKDPFPKVNNDRFLPRNGAAPKAKKKRLKPRLATASSDG